MVVVSLVLSFKLRTATKDSNYAILSLKLRIAVPGAVHFQPASIYLQAME
jgi:hypothetical protein